MGALIQYPCISDFVRDFAKVLYVTLIEKIGWQSSKNDDHLTSLLRSAAISGLSRFAFDDPVVAEEATARFQEFLDAGDNVDSPPNDIRPHIFAIVLKNGGKTEFNQVKSYYYETTDAAARHDVMVSLGAVADPSLKFDAMKWALSSDVKIQDLSYPMSSVSVSSKEGPYLAWQFFQENFEKISSTSVQSPPLMCATIRACAGGLASFEEADEIEAFFKNNPVPGCERTIAQLLEEVRNSAKFSLYLQDSQLSSPEFWSSL
jgi:aminopeptidase N